MNDYNTYYICSCRHFFEDYIICDECKKNLEIGMPIIKQPIKPFIICKRYAKPRQHIKPFIICKRYAKFHS